MTDPSEYIITNEIVTAKAREHVKHGKRDNKDK